MIAQSNKLPFVERKLLQFAGEVARLRLGVLISDISDQYFRFDEVNERHRSGRALHEWFKMGLRKEERETKTLCYTLNLYLMSFCKPQSYYLRDLLSLHSLNHKLLKMKSSLHMHKVT